MYIHLHERYLGALVGVHAGDAKAARFEGMEPKEIEKILEAEGSLISCDYKSPWNKNAKELLPAGMPTDDSDQTADLAWSLITCNGLDSEHLREALRDSVVRGKSRLWDGVSTGSGENTINALSDDPGKNAIARVNKIGTNGSLMRSVPMALWLHGKMHHARVWNNAEKIHWAPEALVAQMSEVTHNHPHSKNACWFYCIMMEGILCDISKDKLLDYIELVDENFLSNKFSSRIQYALKDEFLFPIDPGAWPARGTAEFSLYAALWCFMHSTSFEDGIEKAVRIGGDTDTYAAIAGGLLGAYYGYDAIPADWRKTILGHDAMVDYAEKLYDMNQQK